MHPLFQKCHLKSLVAIVNVTDNSNEKVQCCVREKNVKLSQSDQRCELIKKMLEGRTTGKATIKLEVEFSK